MRVDTNSVKLFDEKRKIIVVVEDKEEEKEREQNRLKINGREPMQLNLHDPLGIYLYTLIQNFIKNPYN